MSASYRLKQIYYLGRSLKIICQNENGPCPLIALCNILLLSGHATIHPDYGEISLDNVIQLVANRILEYSAGSSESSEEVKMMQQQRVNEVISILPTLQFGLDVNVKFESVSSFEYTRELDCFDAAGVSILHGWILDPQDHVTASVIKNMSYNLVIFRLVEARALADELKARRSSDSECVPLPTAEASPAAHEATPPPHLSSTAEELELSPSQKQLLHDGRVIESFLEDTASQLTYLGLLGLYDSLGEGMLCAFFRNNHFSTMLKRDGKLYLLVTDTGYACEPDIVWELLDEIDGNTEFVDSDFRLASQARSQPVGSGQGSPLLADGVINPSRNLIDPDTLLALQLSQSNETSASIPSAVGHVAPPTVHQKEPDTSTSHAQEVFDREAALQLQEQLYREEAAAGQPPAQSQQSYHPRSAQSVRPTEDADLMAARRLQEEWDREAAAEQERVVNDTYHPRSAQSVRPNEDADHMAALRLQEEWDREAAAGQGRVVNEMGVSLSEEQLAAHRQAEMEFYEQRQRPTEPRRSAEQGKASSSSCVLS